MALKKKYVLLVSFILTIIIFSSGIIFGWSFERYKSDVIYDELKHNELNTDSYLTEQEFIDNFGGDKCELLGTRVRDIQATTRELGYQLSQYDSSDTFTASDSDYLKRKYFIFEVRFLNLIKELNNDCDASYNTILFFYDIDDVDSEHQGAILDSFQTDDNYNPIVLSIDREYISEPLVDLLITSFGVEQPSIVINGEFTLPAVVSKEEIIEHLNK